MKFPPLCSILLALTAYSNPHIEVPASLKEAVKEVLEIFEDAHAGSNLNVLHIDGDTLLRDKLGNLFVFESISEIASGAQGILIF